MRKVIRKPLSVNQRYNHRMSGGLKSFFFAAPISSILTTIPTQREKNLEKTCHLVGRIAPVKIPPHAVTRNSANFNVIILLLRNFFKLITYLHFLVRFNGVIFLAENSNIVFFVIVSAQSRTSVSDYLLSVMTDCRIF